MTSSSCRSNQLTPCSLVSGKVITISSRSSFMVVICKKLEHYYIKLISQVVKRFVHVFHVYCVHM